MATQCDLVELKALVPNKVRFEKLAYTICAIQCMKMIGMWVDETDPTEWVSYIFDQGHQGENAAGSVIGGYVNHPETKGVFHYRSHAFVASSDSALLQGSDLLAWEISKTTANSIAREVREPSAAIRTLMSGNDGRYSMDELSGDRLTHAVGIYRDVWSQLFGSSGW